MVRRPKLMIHVMSQPKILPICGLLEDSYSKNIVRISRQVLLKWHLSGLSHHIGWLLKIWRCCLHLEGDNFSIHLVLTVDLHMDVAHPSKISEHISLHCPMTEHFINSKSIWLPIIKKSIQNIKEWTLVSLCGIKNEVFDLCTTTVSSL
jgi:hypothetical protein